MQYGEVWLVDFNPTIGQEINNVRPAIIVNNDNLGQLKLKVVVPITDPQNILPWHVSLIPSNNNGLSKSCAADCFQVKSISQQRFVRKLGTLNEEELSNVKIALVKVLSLY